MHRAAIPGKLKFLKHKNRRQRFTLGKQFLSIEDSIKRDMLLAADSTCLRGAVSRVALLLGSKSQVSSENKLLLYEAILKPIRAYGIQL